MLIFCDKRVPKKVLSNLSKLGEVVEFFNENLNPSPLSGHVDIHICQTPQQYIVTPNLPIKYYNILEQFNINFRIGETPINSFHPNISLYNSVITKKVMICNYKTLLKSILEEYNNLQIIDVNQSYCRCSTMAISDEVFITSDLPTYKKLLDNNFSCFFAHSKSISLPGYKYGLLGGCFGKLTNKNLIFSTGSLFKTFQNNDLKNFILSQNVELIELDEDFLFDVGGIYFFE